MVRLFVASAMLMAGVLVALAQAPLALPQENVTVTATKSREALDKFAKAFSVPTKLTGKIARWETAMCPSAVGQKPAFTAFVTARVRAIAAAVGAPVNADASCTPNIQIIFTTTPQQLLDQVRKDDPDYLGYATISAQREALATITRPVQSWYTTETIDLDGVHRMDSGRKLGNGITMSNFSAFAMPSSMGVNRDPIDLPYATYARVTGNHINDGARTGLNHVIIVIDSKKLAGQSFVSLADYVTMLALTQLNSLDTCQQLSSIVNMMAAGCDQKVDGITATDLAYLRGLYKMDADKSLLFQQDNIADVMADTMGR
ncbi:MAG TPA: hypothetical protein VHX99_02475 [Rhizomicrobium sp.]|jgi:hypothetical protein|nr:hypothetical protein [Rhizomicrobium sp.]